MCAGGRGLDRAHVRKENFLNSSPCGRLHPRSPSPATARHSLNSTQWVRIPYTYDLQNHFLRVLLLGGKSASRLQLENNLV